MKTIDERIAALEIDIGVPKTQLVRIIYNDELCWKLSIGNSLDKQISFTETTIEAVISKAEKALLP